MRRFFKWLFKIFKPDTKGYVRNIQNSQPSGPVSTGYAKSKQKKFDHRVLAWIATRDIVENEEDQQGMSIRLKLRPGKIFQKLVWSDKTKISSKKLGLTKVRQEIHLVLHGDDPAGIELKKTLNNDIAVSLLYRDPFGEAFLYGEHKGFLSDGEEGEVILLKAEENDVFYQVSENCFNELIPSVID